MRFSRSLRKFIELPLRNVDDLLANRLMMRGSFRIPDDGKPAFRRPSSEASSAVSK